MFFEKMKRAEDIDSLHKTTDFDSLGKVKKADDHDCLCMTTDFDSLENVKKADDHDCLRKPTNLIVSEAKKTVIVLVERH